MGRAHRQGGVEAFIFRHIPFYFCHHVFGGVYFSWFQVTHLTKYPENETCTSVAWAHQGSQIACGSSSGIVTLFDGMSVSKARRVEGCVIGIPYSWAILSRSAGVTNKEIRSMKGHTQRATCMSWAAHTLATGSKDRSVLIRDIRSPADYETKIPAHRQVCIRRCAVRSLYLSLRHGYCPLYDYLQEVCGLKWSPDWSMLASGGVRCLNLYVHRSIYSLG